MTEKSKLLEAAPVMLDFIKKCRAFFEFQADLESNGIAEVFLKRAEDIIALATEPSSEGGGK